MISILNEKRRKGEAIQLNELERHEAEWYVIFVKAGSENNVLSQLEIYFDNDKIRPFILKLEVFHKFSDKRIEKEYKIMFPGYVFVESYIAEQIFIGKIKKFIRYFNDPLKLLRYGDSCEFAMRKYEKSILQSICNIDFCVETSIGIIQGDKTTIISGPLKGKEAIIKKIDRSKRKAIIALEFMGRMLNITVGVDIIKKIL